jgi:transposase
MVAKIIGDYAVHFHALWLLSLGYEVEEIAELLSFSPRWVRALINRYNEGGAEALGDQRVHNGTKPMILTPEALTALKERIKTPPDDGGHWTGPKIARWLAKFHGVQAAHDQRGWDALIAIEARMSLRRSMLAGRGGREAESSTVRVDNHSSSLYGMPVIPAKPWPQV